MKFTLLTLSLVIVVFCDARKSLGPAAAQEGFVVKLQRRQARELRCIKRFDGILASKWATKLRKISTKTTGSIFDVTSKSAYNDSLQTWLMENGSPTRRIGTCLRQVVKSVASFMGKNDIECLDRLLSQHVRREKIIEREFFVELKNSSRDQLPFRSFLSFNDLKQLMFQNRNPQAMSSAERRVYDVAENYWMKEKDKDRRIFVVWQECDWRTLRAMKEASDTSAKFLELTSQVRDSVDREIGNSILGVRESLDLEFISQRGINTWVQSRSAMEKRLNKEIRKLRTLRKDEEWLCEYGAKLTEKFSKTQLSILNENARYVRITLKTKEIAHETRQVEAVLKKHREIRQVFVNALATRIERDSRCLEAFFKLVRQHQRFELATAFMNSRFTYPDVFCRPLDPTPGNILPYVCNCSGSFCTASDLAKLNASDNRMVQGRDGVYKIAWKNSRSEIKKLSSI